MVFVGIVLIAFDEIVSVRVGFLGREVDFLSLSVIDQFAGSAEDIVLDFEAFILKFLDDRSEEVALGVDFKVAVLGAKFVQHIQVDIVSHSDVYLEGLKGVLAGEFPGGVIQASVDDDVV